MTVKQLRAFLAVAQSLSFAQAGERLHVSQPALSLEIGDLAPDGLSRYVLVAGQGMVVTIPNYHVANLTALLAGKG